MVIPASQGTAVKLAARGGFEPPITGSKPVAVTAWLPGCVLLVLSGEVRVRDLSNHIFLNGLVLHDSICRHRGIGVRTMTIFLGSYEGTHFLPIPTSPVRTNNAIRFSRNAVLSLFRVDGTAFACHAESGKRTADIRLSLREEFLCACTTSWTRAPLRIHPSKQRLFTFQSGGRGRIRTYGCFHIGGFQDRCISPLCHPSLGGNAET